MGLDQGKKVNPDNFKNIIWHGNYRRLITWCSVGADVENGLWAMLGARLGCYMTNLTSWDYVQVRDFEYLNEMFIKEIRPKFAATPANANIMKCYKTDYMYDVDALILEIANLGYKLRQGLGIEVAELDETQSKFYKAAYVNTPRMNKLFTETELNELRRLNR
jgi:hypothetical protein